MDRIFKRNSKYWQSKQLEIKRNTFTKADDLVGETVKEYSILFVAIRKKIKQYYKKHYINNKFEGTTEKIKKSEYLQLKKEYKNIEGLTKYKKIKGVKFYKDMNYIDKLANDINVKDIIQQTEKNQTQLNNLLSNSYKDDYYQENYMIQKGTNVKNTVKKLTPEKINKVVNAKFKGSDFSHKIWKNKSKMISKLRKELKAINEDNKPINEAIKLLSKHTRANLNDSKRLIRTEQARVMSVADYDSYKDNGVEMFQYVATLDTKTSVIDQDMDMYTAPVSDFEIGENAPPLHPNCRGTTVAYINTANYERMGRDVASGKSEYMPENIKTYQDWAEMQGIN